MKLIIYCLVLLSASSLFAQSKKELQDQVTQLKAQIVELQKPKPQPALVIANAKDSISYGIGVLLASNVKRQVGDTMNIDLLLGGMKEIFNGKPPRIDENKCSMIIQQSMQSAMEKKARRSREDGLAFLENNKKKPGIITTKTGLQYEVIKKGTGKVPTAANSVTVHYTGKLTDGSVFDSSVERGEPATFQVGGVIAGWTEALQLMHEGDKFMLYIPSDLAYGERGSGPQIPPYSTLIFEVELLKVN